MTPPPRLIMVVVVVVLVSVIAAIAESWPWPEPGLVRARPVGEPKFCSGEGQLCFSYNRGSIIGPLSWFNVCQTRKCFSGRNQSPILINPNTIEGSKCGPILGYEDNPTINGSLLNEGIYPVVEELKGEAKLSGVPGFPNTKFNLNNIQIHFRGGKDNRGTEHQLGSKDYDAEMHLVNLREDIPPEEAGMTESGISVVAVFLSTTEGKQSADLDKILNEIGKIKEYRLNLCRRLFGRCQRKVYGKTYFRNEGDDDEDDDDEDDDDEDDDDEDDDDEDNEDDEDEKGLKRRSMAEYCGRFYGKPLRCFGRRGAKECGDLNNPGKCPADAEPKCLDDECGEVPVTFNPNNLLPDRLDFYYYYGSKTSPPLTEAVAWNIMVEPIRITRKQLKLLQSLKSRQKDEKIVVNGNVRPLQKLNGRKVYGNFCE